MKPTEASSQAWPAIQRARRTVAVVDIVESVRLMQLHEDEVIDRWRQFVQEVQFDLLPRHGGRLVKSLGDGLLIDCDSASAGVCVALDLLRRMAEHNGAAKFALALRVGIHCADVVVDGLDVYGSGVNLAARLCSIAEPDAIVVSTEVRDALTDGVEAHVVDLGECHLKHWDQPIRAFRVLDPARPLSGPPAPTGFVDDRASLAVMPFVDSLGAQTAAWGHALAEVITTALSRSPALRVISAMSMLAFRQSSASAGKIRTALGAAYLVTGSYVVDHPRLHVDAKLYSTQDGELRWADRMTADARGIFDGTDQTMAAISGQISLAVMRTEVQRARALPMANLASYTLYLSSVHLLHRLSRPDFDRAYLLLDQLVHRHPRSAAPHAMLSKWHLLEAVQGWSVDRELSRRRAQASARRAVELDPENALALSMGAIVAAQLDKDLGAALQMGEAAVASNPQDAHAWLNLGGIHSYLAHGHEAQTLAQRAIELSPMDPARFAFNAFLAEGRLTAGNLDGAIAAAAEAIRLNTLHATSHRVMAVAQALSGRIAQARAAGQALVRVSPGFRVSQYAENYPGQGSQHIQDWTRALRLAGLPD